MLNSMQWGNGTGLGVVMRSVVNLIPLRVWGCGRGWSRGDQVRGIWDGSGRGTGEALRGHGYCVRP